MRADDTPDTATRRITYDDTNVPNAIRTSYRISPTRRAETVTYYDGSAQEVQRRVRRGPGDVLVSPWLVHNPWRQTTHRIRALGRGDARLRSARGLAGPSRRTPSTPKADRFAPPTSTAPRAVASYRPFELILFDADDLDPTHPHTATPRREEVDVWNHRTAVFEDAGGGRVHTLRFDVGLFGELLALRDDAGTVATYRYDRRGHRLAVEHRDAGRREQWFNSHGEIVRMRDAAGNDITVDRDPEGRVTEVQHDGAVVESFVYDDVQPAAPTVAWSRHATPTAGRASSYALRGFLERHEVEVAGQTFMLALRDTTTSASRRALTYPDGTRIERRHYDNGMVEAHRRHHRRMTYNARNLPARVAYANGVVTEIEYEPGVGYVSHQRTVGPGGTVIEDARYGYDADDASCSRSTTNRGRTLATWQYELRRPAPAATRVRRGRRLARSTFRYAYDGRSNVARNDESGGCCLRRRCPARPADRGHTARRGCATRSQHDANGNLSQMPGRDCSYDFKNHLTRVTLADGTVVQYDYDYRGNRVRRRDTRQGTTIETIYIGRFVEFRGGQHTNFVVLDRRRIAVKLAGGMRWIHSDPLGNANHFSDEAGTEIGRIAYHPFGGERSRQGTPILRLFASHDIDELTGLVYMGHRWYATELGRFLTPDPLYLLQPEKSEGDPGPLHLYTYVGNNPMTQVDPEGLSLWSVVGAIVGVIVGIVIAVAIVAAFASGIGFGVLAVIGLIGLMTVSYAVAHSNQGNGIGEFFRGFMIGLNAGMNATFLAMLGPVGAVIGVAVGVTIFLASIDSVANNEVYQGILGWSNWLMPMSWLVLGLGAVMWVLNGLGHLIFWSIPQLWGGGIQSFRITGFKMDWSTGMLATRGGWVANLNPIDTAYNMGAFAYVDSNSTGWHLDHEAGHNLSLGAFGSIFHFVGFIHEMGTSAGAGAYSEQIAESNDPAGAGSTVPMWA